MNKNNTVTGSVMTESAPQSGDSLKDSIKRHLCLTLARHLKNASKREIWMATCYAVRDQVVDRFINTQSKHSGSQDTASLLPEFGISNGKTTEL